MSASIFMSKTDVTPAILSRDFVARQNRKCDMACRATSQQSRNFFLIRTALYSVPHCHENAVNAYWPIIIYATKLQCATQHVTLAILSHDKVARQNRVIKLQMWHRSKYSSYDVIRKFNGQI